MADVLLSTSNYFTIADNLNLSFIIYLQAVIMKTLFIISVKILQKAKFEFSVFLPCNAMLARYMRSSFVCVVWM